VKYNCNALWAGLVDENHIVAWGELKARSYNINSATGYVIQVVNEGI